MWSSWQRTRQKLLMAAPQKRPRQMMARCSRSFAGAPATRRRVGGREWRRTPWRPPGTREFALQLASGRKVHLYSGPERPQEPPQIVVQVRLEAPATS
jgi:hypothetical protein